MNFTNYDPNNPFMLHELHTLCAICTKQLEKDKTCSLSSPITPNTFVKAYQVLESISKFKFHEAGPKFVCSICFKNIASTHKFQQICNRAQELIKQCVEYQQPTEQETETFTADVKGNIVPQPERYEIVINPFNNDGFTATNYNFQAVTPNIAVVATQPAIETQTIEVVPSVAQVEPTVEKKYKCTYCESSFNQWQTWKNHINVHEQTYTCSFCGKALGSKNHLVLHERIHTGEKPYKCGYCEWAFRTKEGLDHHTLTHTKERPYKCDVCKKTFNRRGTLRTHVKRHTGERPHVCTICGSAFLQPAELKKHIKIHYKVKVDPLKTLMAKIIADNEAKKSAEGTEEDK